MLMCMASYYLCVFLWISLSCVFAEVHRIRQHWDNFNRGVLPEIDTCDVVNCIFAYLGHMLTMFFPMS